MRSIFRGKTVTSDRCGFERLAPLFALQRLGELVQLAFENAVEIVHRQLYAVRRRSQNMVIQQRDDQARSQVPGKVDRDRFRRRIAIKDFSVNNSVRRRLPAQVNTGSPVEVRNGSTPKPGGP